MQEEEICIFPLSLPNAVSFLFSDILGKKKKSLLLK